MKEDQVGESIISQRLRRLREEGDEVSKFWGPRSDVLPMPTAGQAVRSPEYVETLVEVVELNRDGELQAFMHATVADANAAPFEKIVHRNWITRIEDDEKTGALRIRAGLRLRSLYEGAQVSALKGQNYESGGGGRGGVPAPVGDQTLDCIRKLAEIEKSMPADAFRAAVDVVCKDAWIWEGKKGGAIAKEVDRVLCGLDWIACRLGYVTETEVKRRWPARLTGSPGAPAADRTA